MSLDKNNKLQNLKDGWWQNYPRLLVWCLLVQMLNTVLYNTWSKIRCYPTSCTDWDSKANNYRFFHYWKFDMHDNNRIRLYKESRIRTKILQQHDIELSAESSHSAQSKTFKEVYLNTPKNMEKEIPKCLIYFISTQELMQM